MRDCVCSHTEMGNGGHSHQAPGLSTLAVAALRKGTGYWGCGVWPFVGLCTDTPSLSLKKEDPSAVPIFTMDYGVLDFQGREKTPEPPASSVHTEYATIVFPEGLGTLSPGRRGSANDPQCLRPPRQQDGHCSWPL